MNNILSRKVQLVPVGDEDEVNRVYTYLREGMKAQNAAMNQCRMKRQKKIEKNYAIYIVE